MIAEVALLKSAVSKVFGDLVSKAVSDGVDISIKGIKDADQNRKFYSQNLQTQIYHVIVDSLNEFTYSKYKEQDKLYNAAESILKGFASGKDNTDTIKSGLKMLVSGVNDDTCQEFLEVLYGEICREDNSDLYKEIDMLWKKKESEYIRKEFEKSNQYDRELLGKFNDLEEAVNYISENIGSQERRQVEHYEIPIVNRAEEYAGKWDENTFLNNFNEEDENAGVNIKLKDIYIEECLPHYVWKTNSRPSDKLKSLLKKYVIDNNDKKMLLILGQPGIGKSTLITWIMANLVEKKDDILVYQFANDLGGINWQGENVLNDIFNIISLEYDELENKTLILDGFDEIYVGGDRERILNKLEQELKRRNVLRNFSLIITCRENYIYNLQNIDCDYIVLQAWNEIQIEIFCRAYWEKCGNNILADKIQRIMENKEIFGIPLILYMVLALNIDIETNSSIVDIYDQIFSLKKGSIYDRCYDSEHRINKPEIKEHIHRISQKIAFWMFENNANEAFISQEKFREICESEMSEEDEDMQSNTLIGNFFKLKYCEGEDTDELQFVHRSIYEYFVAVYFYESIYKLTSKEAVAGNLGKLLKDGHLSEQLLVFIKYKFDRIKRCNLASEAKEVFNVMLQDGMTYHIGTPCKNAIEREENIFSNMLKVVSLWNPSLGALDKRIAIYLQYNRKNELNLRGVDLIEANLSEANLSEADLRGANLSGANLSEADLSEADLSGADLRRADLRQAYLSGADLRGTDLSGANLSGADLSEADLIRADLSEADLIGADLSGADLRGANLIGAYLVGAYLRRADLRQADLNGAGLIGADLGGADLSETTFDEGQINLLREEYDLTDSKVYISETNKIESFKEYCFRKQ